jgi:hypothetical protein
LVTTTNDSNRQFTKVLDRKKANDGGDDPENAKNASRIERLNQMVQSKTYKSWKEDVEKADNPSTRGTTFTTWYVLTSHYGMKYRYTLTTVQRNMLGNTTRR